MTSIQYDYSTLSTSISSSELNSGFLYNMINEIPEDESFEESPAVESIQLPPVPADRYNFVYLVFGLLGIGTLLPWNFFITAHDYWMYKFRNASNISCFNPNDRTDLQASFTSYLAVATNGPYVTFLILSAFFNGRGSQVCRVISSLIAMIMIFLVMTALVKVDTDHWQNSFFGVTMFQVVIMGVFSAILQSEIAGVASILPPRYMHVMVLGQAVAGIFAALTQIATLMGHCSPVTSAFAYFLCADVFLLFMLLAYLLMQKESFFLFHIHHSGGNRVLKDVTGSSLVVNVPLFSVLKKVWPYAVSILLDFWVTIGVFPGVAVLVVSEYEGDGSMWTGWLFLPLTCFVLFNVSDLCGRIIGGWIQFPPSWRYRLLTLCVFRIVFIPLFMLCNAQPRSNLPVIFNSDIYYIAFMSMLGLTNGFLATITMIGGTKFMSQEFQEITGMILSAFLGAGLMLGSLSSYLFVQIL